MQDIIFKTASCLVFPKEVKPQLSQIKDSSRRKEENYRESYG